MKDGEKQGAMSAVSQVKEMNLNTACASVCVRDGARSLSEHNSWWHANHPLLVKELEEVSCVGRKGSSNFLTLKSGGP